MGSEYQPGPPESKGLEIALVLLRMIVVWSALLVGVIAHFLIQQRTRNPFPYWSYNYFGDDWCKKAVHK